MANYIECLLSDKGLKQKDLADKMGKSEAEISKWLSGSHNFTLRSIAKIETVLDVKIIEFPQQKPHIQNQEDNDWNDPLNDHWDNY